MRIRNIHESLLCDFKTTSDPQEAHMNLTAYWRPQYGKQRWENEI